MSGSEQGREEKFKIGDLGKNQILMVVAVILIAVGAGVYSHWFTADAYVREGNELTLKGKSDEAKKAYDKAIELDPKNVNAYLGRAMLDGELGDFDKVLELSPQNVDAYIGRAEVLCYPDTPRLDKYNKAIEDCNKAIELDPQSLRAFCVRAKAYSLLENYKSAEADCGRALEIEPQSVRACQELADIFECQGDYKHAIDYYKMAIDIASSKHYKDTIAPKEYATSFAEFGKEKTLRYMLAGLYGHRGQCHAYLGERNAAVRDAILADDILQYTYGTLHKYGEQSYKQGKYLDAIFYFSKHIKDYEAKEQQHGSSSFLDKVAGNGKEPELLYPIGESYEGLAKAYYAQGNTYYHERNFVGAIENYTKAIETNPQYAYAYNNRACCYDEQGEYAQAVADYTKAIELKPDYIVAYNNRGRTHQRLGNTAQAEADFAKANELEGK